MTSAATFPATGPDALSGSDEAGFTLLEVIVTIAILALTFTILFQTIAETVDRTGQSENLGRAQLLARSLLDQVGRELPDEGRRIRRRGRQWSPLAASAIALPGSGRQWPIDDGSDAGVRRNILGTAAIQSLNHD